ncbi:signal peptide protein [Paenibacillus sp. GCM10023252]|uniref:signal peptide protein n=1 Tax=Paenibacillus sp. GCM10023252 TaxID=3252649 RepID=UPI003620158B
MSYYGHRPPDRHSGGNGDADISRILSIVVGGVFFIIVAGFMLNACQAQSSSWDTSAVSWQEPSATYTVTDSSSDIMKSDGSIVATLPWDYRVVEGTVGDLIGSDMTILPDNEMLPNDSNYGTGDKVWTLQFMEATMRTSDDKQNEVTLAAWNPIKSFKSKEAAEKDMAQLKLRLTSEVELVGVYKTERSGETRQFAVLSLPSGHQIKQPIDEKRYQTLKPLSKVNVVLEEVHDYSNYDMAYAKFRGWASP